MDLNRKKPLILAVDDNEDNLFLLRFQLEALLDCSLMTANNGTSALALVQKQFPDLMLLDMMLPDMTGIDVVQKLRQSEDTARIPIVAVTAFAGDDQRDRMITSGCNDYLSKPYDLKALEEIIQRYLEHFLGL